MDAVKPVVGRCADPSSSGVGGPETVVAGDPL
jgi:hypothetical protein